MSELNPRRPFTVFVSQALHQRTVEAAKAREQSSARHDD
jgi:hypothetical protein